MARVHSCLGVLAMIAVVFGGRAAAQPAEDLERLLGRPIVAVAVISDGHALPDPTLAPLIDTRVGQPFSMIDVRRTLRALTALDRFDEITVRAREQGTGVSVSYDVRLVRKVDAIAFSGERGLPDRQLRAALRERFGEQVRHGRRAAEMRDLLVETLRQAGYLDARATWRLEPRSSTSATLVFVVAAGARVTIGGVAVSGQPLESAEKLQQRLGVATGRPWRETTVRDKADREARGWRAKGYYQARIDVVPTRREGQPVVDLRVDAVRGPMVQLVFEGDPLPKSRLADLVPVEREGAVDEDLLEDSKRRVETYLRSQGYWKAQADYRRTPADGKLTIVFTVKRGRLYEVDEMVLTGLDPAERDRVSPGLSLEPGRPFVEELLERDLAIVLRHVQELGHPQAKVTRSVQEAGSPTAATGRVRIGITVEQGPRTEVGAITLDGNRALEEATLRQAMQLKPGEPFFAPLVAADRSAVETTYHNRGFPDAKVAVSAQPAPDGPRANLDYTIREGEQAVIQHVIVTGNERTGVDTILREARLSPGQPLGAQDLADAQRRLSALGLFRRIRIEALPEGGERLRNVVISVEENAATTIGYGAGLEGGRRLRADASGTAVEQFEFAPRGFFEVGRRNLWGKNRSINLFSRASLRQNPGTTENPDPGGYGLYEYRVLGTYREPRAFGSSANATVAAVIEQAIRTSFSYRRRGINGDLSRRLARNFTVGARYNYSYTDVYEDRSAPEDEPLVDRLFPQVRLSVVAGLAAWDTRDDPLAPTKGHLVGIESDLATRALGSEVGYSKTFTQAFIYRQLPRTRMVFAGGARLGLAWGFAREAVDENGNLVVDDNGNPVYVDDLPASERFYAGGDTTVRGYTLDRLGDDDTIDQDGFPLGGDAVVIFNGELRFPLTQTLGGVVFVDAGNVFSRVANLDLARIKATTGFGIRYKSPIGPLRIDLGFKLDPRVESDGTKERGYALHISVGQAF